MSKSLSPSLICAFLSACASNPCGCHGPVNPEVIAAGDIELHVNEREGCSPISPLIYGTNSPEIAGTFPFRRLGGEAWSAYNWENNKRSLHGGIKEFSTISSPPSPEEPAPGKAITERALHHVNAGARVLLTIPMLGHVAGDTDGPVAFDPATGGATQTALDTRYKTSRARKGADLLLQPDKNDGFVNQDELVNWIKDHFGPSRVDATNGSIFFALDNEPDIWEGLSNPEAYHNFAHRLLHPGRITKEEVIGKNTLYAQMIKDQAPNALVFG